MTRSKMAIQAEESRADQKVKAFKPQLADELALEPVDDSVELEEIVEEAEGDEEGEPPIRDCQEKIKKKEEKEKKEEIKEKEEKKSSKMKNKKKRSLSLKRRRERVRLT